MPDSPKRWTLVYADGEKFKKTIASMTEPVQVLLKVALEELLLNHGIDLASESWLKSLGQGLWELRVGPTTSAAMSRTGVRDLKVVPHANMLLRIFCAFEGRQIVVILSLYDKGANNSKTEQRRQIDRARRLLRDFKNREKS